MHSYLVTNLLHNVYIFSWQDAIEICILSFLCYLCFSWLAQDKTKNLLCIFYGFCLFLFCTIWLELNTITLLLLLYCPVFCMILILTHQEQLQKKLVSLFNIQAPRTTISNNDWITVLIQAVLHAGAQGKTVYGAIEKNHQLNLFLKSNCILDTTIHSALLQLIFESNYYIATHLLWIQKTGRLTAINAQWNLSKDFQIHDTDYEQWLNNAYLLSVKTDALFMCYRPATTTFCIMVNGTYFEQLSSVQTIGIIKQHLHISYKSKKGALNYESSAYTPRSEQSTEH